MISIVVMQSYYKIIVYDAMRINIDILTIIIVYVILVTMMMDQANNVKIVLINGNFLYVI